MSSIRQKRVQAVIQAELGSYFREQARTVCLGAMVTVTEVRMVPDMSYLKAYLSIFGHKDVKEVHSNIKKHKDEIRYEMGKRLGKSLRRIPDLSFFIDDTLNYSEEIEKLLGEEVNSSFFIARRYLFSKKTQNVINIISGVSVFGIMISTAAMVIILSGFNGIEGLVLDMFNSFESDIEITSKNSKTFDRTFVPDEVYEMEGIVNYSRVIEEIAIVKNLDNFIIGTIKGVEEQFLQMCEMDEHLIDGQGIIEDDYGYLALIGGGAIENLDGYIYQIDQLQYETFTIYSPNKEKKISGNKLKNIDAFTTSQIPIVGVFGYNNDVDQDYLIVPLTYAAEIFNYKSEITQVEIDFAEGTDLDEKKAELELIMGSSFQVKTSFQQNQLIFDTSQSEKWITTLLLGFIFFLATFNMIASITMLVIEKKENMKTLSAIGAKENQLRRIFFFEGLLINGLGLIFGLLIGYGVCYLQMKFGLIRMENSSVEYFPIILKWSDLILILGITMTFGTLAAYLPSRFLIKRIIK